MRKILSYFLATALTFSFSAFAAPNYNVINNTNSSSLSGYVLHVPAGITCSAVLTQGLNSNSAIIGDSVSVLLTSDFKYNNTLIAPSGSTISGIIVQNQKAGYGDRNAKMMLKFTTITTPYGNNIPISAVVATSDNTGVLKGSTTKDSAIDYAKNTAIGATSGAVLGTALGAMAGGSVGKGAIYGTALGAGLGVAKNAISKGEDIIIPANSEINLYFNQPITLGAQ